MGEQELAEMRVRANSADIYGPRDYAWLARYVLRLVAEVERLRAELAKAIHASDMHWEARRHAAAENAALRSIAQAVANMDQAVDNAPENCCPFCHVWIGSRTVHTADCPVTKARALLGETDQKASE